MKRSTTSMTATKLRVILAICMLTISLLAAGLFYVGYHQLKALATDVRNSVGVANASKNSLTSLQQTEQDLKANQDIVTRASRVVADGQDYAYQNMIITDLQTYANRTGLTINTIDFSANSANTGTSAAPAADSGTSKTAKVTVTLKNPVNYDNLLHFMRSIEQNLTKLQIANIGLSKAGDDAKSVTTNSLSIELYTK